MGIEQIQLWMYMAAKAAAPMAAESAMEDIPSANSFLDTLTSVEILNNKNY